jgi:hypothetical protein
MNKIAFIIDGEAVDAGNGATFDRKDPMTVRSQRQRLRPASPTWTE